MSDTNSPVTNQQSVPGPVPASERLVGLDVLRGFALLGILLMNIRTFGMIMAAYFFPTSYGDLTGLNLAAWWFTDISGSIKGTALWSSGYPRFG